MNLSYGSHDHLFDKIKFKLDDGTIDPEKRSFWVLLSSLVLFVAWIIFLTYYLSRIAGPIVSFILNSAAPSAYWDRIWSLVGVIKLDIWSGRIVIGNRLLPYMLVVSLENMNSKVRLRESAADRALLSVEGQAESVRAAFLKHPDYEGAPYKDPPRTMGDGFAILQSALLHFFYHQDILGYVTVDEQSIITQRPIWESIWRFDHNTVISYGPWAEHQRALLYGFFFPSDYQTVVPDELPKRGKRRIHIMHDVRISLLKETAVDIWFMRGDQLESVHSRCQPGSTIDMSIWWITKEDGFSWSMHTSLLRLESTSSLPYRKLLEAETFSVNAEFHYPRDLINEFLGDTTSDLVTFIPYTVAIDFDVTDSFEGIILLNESNWVDPSEKNPENVEAAIVGSHFNISFTLPFEDFLPELVSTTYSIRMENGLALRMRYPPGSATASVMAALSRGAHTNMYSKPSPHGRHSKNNEEWHEVWRTESVISTIEFTYHPLVPKFASDLPFHVLQEFLPKPAEHPKDLSPDKMNVTLEIGGSEVRFTGALIKFVIELKNNYFGLYDSMTDVTQPEDPSMNRSIYNRVPVNAAVESYRPMAVTFDMRVFNIRAHCLTYTLCSDERELCPVLYTEEIAVLIKKGFSETLIQVGVGACAAYFERVSSAQSDGYLTLSGLQFRGHAMFSSEDCPWDMAVVEYGWLMEILIGDIGGCLGSPSQIISLANFLDTLLLLVVAKDEEKIVPERFKFCQHGQKPETCSVGSQPGRPCETEERLKYRQMRLSVDEVRLALAEENSAITVVVDPLRFTLCNAHEKRFMEHICLRIPNITARYCKPITPIRDVENLCSILLKVQHGSNAHERALPLPFPAESSHLEVLRQRFLLKHDKLTKRLQFLWDRTSVWGCACYGGTAFMAKEDLLLFREELHQYFTVSRKSSNQSKSTTTESEMPSVDTASFHSAMSKAAPVEKCLLTVRPLIEAYCDYLDHFEVARTKSEAPQFGAPGDIAQWIEARTFKFFEAQEGVAGVHLMVEHTDQGSSRAQPVLLEGSCEMVDQQQLKELAAKSLDRSLAINGCVASALDVDWEKSPLASRLLDTEPRVVVDFQIPDFEVMVERRESRQKSIDVSTKDKSGSLPLVKALHLHKAKVEVGAINTLIVMPRPLEMTGKSEFPLYDVLSPCLTTWLHVTEKLFDAINEFSGSWSAMVDMTFAQVLKMALDCTDDRVFNAGISKSVMLRVKQLGAHQAGCPSCLLLHTVLRWCALPTSAEKLSSSPASLGINPQFSDKANRKTALMALLSHWHTDICQQVKLASNAEARKYRAEPGSFAREVRLPIEDLEKKPEIKHRRNASTASRNLTTNGGLSNQRRSSAQDQKVDLYHWLLSVHRERKERKPADLAGKDYINPMEIMPQAFFYSFYRSRRLDWTQLDGLPLDQLSLTYTITVNNVTVAMVEQRIVSSAADTSRKFITPHLHQLMHIKKVAVDGRLSWRIEMDEKGLLPVRGWCDLTYKGNVENVRFVVALCSVCLIKEIMLVAKTCVDTPNELKRRPSAPPSVTNRSPVSVQSNLTGKSRESVTWDERVLDMMRDFEKNRSRSTRKKRGDVNDFRVLMKINGELEVDSVRLESILTDLYVSLMVQLIELTQRHNPNYEYGSKIPGQTSQKNTGPADMVDMKLRKASLALMESDNSKQNTHIVNCTLHESTAKLTRRPAESSADEPLTTLNISLGAIEGELPMAAHSLHDVVMRHGPQLEQQFNRLSAQPTLLNNPLMMPAVSLPEIPVVESGTPTPWYQKGGDPKKAMRTRPSVAKVKFDFETSSIELRARLLPSLLARYKLNRASSSGVTGDAAKWTASIESHNAEFCVSSAGKPMDTFTLALPAIAVDGEYTVDKGDTAPATNKTLLYREGGYLKMSVSLGQVNHSFTTDLLNQILFAEQSFRSELSALIIRLRAERFGWAPATTQSPSAEKQPPLLFFLTVKGQGMPWLQLTAATPTATAVRFTIESLDAELTNRWVVKEQGSAKERLFGAAAIQFNAKLGQLVKVAQYEELQPELQEYATFMTQVRVENKESSSHQSYSYHIALNRPILLIKSSAIDKAILLWLNYKNTYDYWRAERSRVVRAANKRSNSFQHAMFSPPQASQDFDVNLSLAINNGMYVCMPLYSQDLTDGMPALVLSLQKSDVTVCIMKELACQASFHGFKLNFIDNFDELSLSESVMEATGETQTNYFFFPQGTYQLCSQASADAAGAKWVLSVRSQMRGMVIDLDQRIGKLAKMVVNTFSSLGDNEDDFDDKGSHVSEDEDHLVEGGSELKTLRPEERVPWMERKMHEQSTLVSDLIACKASEKRIEAERKKLRQYELIRFKEFRRSMIEKIRRRKNTANKGEKRPRTLSIGHLPKPVKVASEARTADSDDSRGQTENVKMHIDVQVSIESGRCTLRTAPKQEQSAIVPIMVKKPSTKDLRSKAFASSQPANFTRFSIPSLDMKGYYLSADSGSIPTPISSSLTKEQLRESASISASAQASSTTTSISAQRKRGCFYLSAALASMPTETVVTPHLADYFEQVLEPLPISSGATVTSVPSVAEPQEGVAHIVGMDTSALPIDVLFFLTVQSSAIRFDGQQQRSSAADCLLKLPCLSLMATTRRTVGETYVGGIDVSATLSAFSLSIYSPHQQSTAHDALSLTLDHLSFVISRSKNSSVEADNRVKFVLTSSIGAANFNYDMRRLSELMAFPKPWYRAAIARRVFFGDQAMSREPASQPSTIASHNLVTASARPAAVRPDKAWSATVLLAVQWKELNVNAQMSNTMGNTSWRARRGLLRAIAKLNSKSERNVTLTFKLDSSELTAHGGAISGEIALSRLLLSASHARLVNQPPQNGAKVQLRWLAARVEWMSRPILIGRCEKPAISLGDEFLREKNEQGEYIRACVRLNVKGSWEDLQVVITRGTVDDIQKIINKLKTFFEEQLKSSKMVWGIRQDSAASATQPKQEETPSQLAYATQFWQKVLDSVTEIQFKQKILPIPQNGETVVGGFVGLEAGRVSLACMHGEMSAHSWALFHMRHPGIIFTPEAKFSYIDRDDDVIGVAVRQKLIIRLGPHDAKRTAANNPIEVPNMSAENMATVCRVQQNRNSIMRQNASISTSLEYLIGDALKQIGLATATDAPAPSTRGQHSVLELFQFPALEAVLISDQMNECDVEELDEDERPEDSPLPVEKPVKKTDRRRYLCEKWAVDPKIRFIDRFRWNPPVIDEILRKLQIFDHRTTIPKALQRAVLDPLDQGLAMALYELLRLVDRTKPHDRSSGQDTITASPGGGNATTEGDSFVDRAYEYGVITLTWMKAILKWSLVCEEAAQKEQ
ncbi:hypothetical protein ANCCEY_05883 [Ancylostoma ceylanicum]|uniref:Bridge-like lipid transfer protein family member 1 C-terminal domain-containing protein n=1 Tax=Ancylostoma ceylanicum TaxID=53326 RepID=A0A0D6LT11_9BILA|nr:hypothetical protein ANCCEY_05883 [Ancylostoma ceylanicum]